MIREIKGKFKDIVDWIPHKKAVRLVKKYIIYSEMKEEIERERLKNNKKDHL